MGSAYLASAEFAAYGVPAGTTAAQITAASTLIDAYLRRPEGLQWLPDAAGLPCYMAGLSPYSSLKSQQAISPGQNVSVPVAAFPGMLTATGSVGDVVILDRANANGVEACVITAVSTTAITLQSVVNTHSINCTIDFGLVIREQRFLPAKRTLTRVASWPVARMLSAAGTYRFGRRSDQTAGRYSDQNLMAIMQTFGGPPQWTLVDLMQSDVNPNTGEVWIPSGLYLAYYSEVRLYYVAGYSQANIPPIIKQVAANAIAANVATAPHAGGMKIAKAGGSTLERFSDSITDPDMRQQLDMYRARLFI